MSEFTGAEHATCEHGEGFIIPDLIVHESDDPKCFIDEEAKCSTDTQELLDLIAQQVNVAVCDDRKKVECLRPSVAKNKCGVAQKKAKSKWFRPRVIYASKYLAMFGLGAIAGGVSSGFWTLSKVKGIVYETAGAELDETTKSLGKCNNVVNELMGKKPIDDEEKKAQHQKLMVAKAEAKKNSFARNLASNTVTLITNFGKKSAGGCQGGIIKNDAVLTAKHCLTADDNLTFGYTMDVLVIKIDEKKSTKKWTEVNVVPTDLEMQKKPVYTAIAIDPTRDAAVIVFSDPTIFEKFSTLQIAEEEPKVGDLKILGKIIDKYYYLPLVGDVKYFIPEGEHKVKIGFLGENGDSGSPVVNLKQEITGIMTSVENQDPEKPNEPLSSFITVITKDRVEELYAEAKAKLKDE